MQDNILIIDKGQKVPPLYKTIISEDVIKQISKAILFTELNRTALFDLHLTRSDLNILREAVSWSFQSRDEDGTIIAETGESLKFKIHYELVGGEAITEYLNFRNIINNSYGNSFSIDITDDIFQALEDEESN